MDAALDHKAFVAGLDPQDRVHLTQRSDALGLAHLAAHVGLILICGIWIWARAPFWQVLLPVQGILLVFLFTLEHECTHKTPFANPTLNDWVGRAGGVVLILPFEWFRYFHLAHHRWTNLPGQDPELASPKPQTWNAWVWHVSGLPFWLAGLRTLVRLATKRERAAYLPESALPRLQREALVVLCVYALSLAYFGATLFWVWLVPILLGQPFLRLFLLAEHGDCPMVANMFANTRTTFTNRVVRFLAWNMPYHVEHHVYPMVPFHKLPELHARMRAHLQITADGYRTFTREYLLRRVPR